jgi:hypothetical protein
VWTLNHSFPNGRQGADNEGVTLSELNRFQEALVIYDELLARFAEAPEPRSRRAACDSAGSARRADLKVVGCYVTEPWLAVTASRDR